ncbi:MAG: glycine/betaine/sarcosine/D-proline family reductase selenoprotein B [Gammaproteobacteria bacterium]|nr:glycine/betaine/sarcosine/D-proline family reductase selenoprotein B [Gammaproteobacteria bacterium]
MVRMTEMPAVGRGFISRLEMPELKHPAWTQPVPAQERRVAIVSTAAVSRRGEKPFSWLARDYRVIPKGERDLVMTHVAVEYDRTAWQQDLNAIIPLDRLDEMAQDGEIGSVANEHYAFMGAADPRDMEKSALEVAERMTQEDVNTVFLIPV